MVNLTESQVERYSRHILLNQIGVEGQERLLKGKVLIIGVGGLGAPIALYLAAAGVGTLGLIDGDRVELSNLQRQIIHFTSDIGRFKVESAKEKISQLNPDVTVHTYATRFTPINAFELIQDYDFIIDGTDHFSTKFLINDACVMAKKPFSHGGILRFEGQTMTYVPGQTCVRCLFDESQVAKGMPTTCSQAGVVGAIAGLVGTVQALEAVKFLTGAGDLLKDQLWVVEAETMRTNIVRLQKRDDCAVCGPNPLITELKVTLKEGCHCQVKCKSHA